MRSGLESIVHSDPELQLVRADTPDLARIAEARADVVVLDLPDGEAPRVTSGRLAAEPLPAVVALIPELKRTSVQRLLASGVRAVLPRESPAREILAAIHATAAGLAVVSPEVLDVLVPATFDSGTGDDIAITEPLTEREMQVLAALAEGAGNKEIAARLQISEHTVKFHVSAILAKLGAATRTEAVARGYREGLIVI